MRYIGSKTSTLPALERIILPRVREGSFCDPFAGVGTVGSHFKQLGFQVFTGDVLRFAHFFQIARIRRQRSIALRRLCAAMNWNGRSEAVAELRSARHARGWFFEEYAVRRRFFTRRNAAAINGCWRLIREWQREDLLSVEEHAVLIASLINCMDKVANTAGTYYAFLKGWHRKALKPFSFELLQPSPGPRECECAHASALKLTQARKYDVLYLDPPYNERSYAHYYHLPETLALSVTRRVHGIAGAPVSSLERSSFNDPRMAATSLRVLLEGARFRLLAFHYSDDGLIPRDVVREILAEHGTLEEFELTSRGYTTEKAARRVSHRLYLVGNG